MKLILTEIPKNYRDHRFPPIFRNKFDVPPADKVNMHNLNASTNAQHYDVQQADHASHQQ